MAANKKYAIAIVTFVAWMMVFFQNMTTHTPQAKHIAQTTAPLSQSD